MNLRLIGKYLSYIVFAEGLFMIPAMLVSRVYGEYHIAAYFVAAIFICMGVALALYLLGRGRSGVIYPREGFVVAGGGWMIISALGALPFWFSGEFGNYVNCFFEAVSGFTTTGASILTQVENISHGLLFWRSFSHWLGGIGILVFILAVVHAQGQAAGGSLQLLRAESTGPQIGKILPKTRESVKALYLIYVGMSLLNLVLLLVGGMPVFDAFCTMFGTAGTGGFGIKNDSMASYSPYLQNVCTVFMAIFGVNFSLYYFLIKKQWKTIIKDEEFRTYVAIMLGSTLLVTLSLFFAGGIGGFGYDLHHSAFTVSSVMTTTGFATLDFDAWPQFSRALLLILMACGTMAGSTGGGIKVSRLLILFKSMRSSLHRLLHPRSVRAVRLNGKPLDDAVINGTLFYLAAYCAIGVASFLLLSLSKNMDMETNISAMMACFNNIGPGLGLVGPTSNYSAYSIPAKLLLSLLMLLGRLEIFPIIILFNPPTWRRKA